MCINNKWIYEGITYIYIYIYIYVINMILYIKYHIVGENG